MKLLERGTKSLAKPILMTCSRCESKLEIEEADWQKGTYGSEMVAKCMVCGTFLVKPGTEYDDTW
jgi:NAD-dependent SIR2 family protein deacetylase